MSLGPDTLLKSKKRVHLRNAGSEGQSAELSMQESQGDCMKRIVGYRQGPLQQLTPLQLLLLLSALSDSHLSPKSGEMHTPTPAAILKVNWSLSLNCSPHYPSCSGGTVAHLVCLILTVCFLTCHCNARCPTARSVTSLLTSGCPVANMVPAPLQILSNTVKHRQNIQTLPALL